MRRLLSMVASLPASAVIAVVRAYQLLISPWLGRRCRFEPSCSRYMIEAVQKYGCLYGMAKGVARICRCHPWHPGGFDPP
jgi:uncharacterized protein